MPGRARRAAQNPSIGEYAAAHPCPQREHHRVLAIPRDTPGHFSRQRHAGIIIRGNRNSRRQHRSDNLRQQLALEIAHGARQNLHPRSLWIDDSLAPDSRRADLDRRRQQFPQQPAHRLPEIVQRRGRVHAAGSNDRARFVHARRLDLRAADVQPQQHSRLRFRSAHDRLSENTRILPLPGRF